ncbi:MAG: ElyC/SanA/YdcF family protein [Patescibacteria group bacterium]|jgi:SanA protein
MKIKKIVFYSFTFVVFAIIVLFFVSQFLVWRAAEGKMFSVAAAPSETVVIVPGASVLRSGQPSDMLADRLLTAIDLYQAGKVRKFLLSGDHGRTDYDEVEAMREYLLARDIPDEDIVLDHAGFDTYDTMVRAHEIFQLEAVLVVSQTYHLSRIIYIGENNDMEVYGVSADRQTYVKIEYFKLRESLARVKAVLNVWFNSSPKYLGEPIPIVF